MYRHMYQNEGNFSAEEGDCRYMAPEFLQMEVDRSKLPKSDIYSLGMTIYEAASLLVLPKNSDDCSANAHDYNDLKVGKLRYLKEYSKEFNSLCRRASSSRSFVLNFLWPGSAAPPT